MTLFQTLELFNSDDFQGPIIENIPNSKPWFQQAQNFKKKTLKKLAPCILIQFMQGSTVFYPPLPSPPLPSQPSVRKVYLKYLSTSLHQPVFEVSLRHSSQILLLGLAINFDLRPCSCCFSPVLYYHSIRLGFPTVQCICKPDSQ